jgi:RNA 2',3'-cyclic 3'-phosphodiesterase
MPRYFVAVPLPAETAELLTAVQPAATAGMRLVPGQEFHLTLHFLGEVLPQQDEVLRAALARVGKNAFAIDLRGVGRFPPDGEPRVLWVGVEKSPTLLDLRASVSAVLTDAVGYRPEARPYSPHVTLAYLDLPVSPAWTERYLEENKGLQVAAVPVGRFVLYSSVSADNEPRYREEATFHLAGSASSA